MYKFCSSWFFFIFFLLFEMILINKIFYPFSGSSLKNRIFNVFFYILNVIQCLCCLFFIQLQNYPNYPKKINKLKDLNENYELKINLKKCVIFSFVLVSDPKVCVVKEFLLEIYRMCWHLLPLGEHFKASERLGIFSHIMLKL